MNLKNIKIIFYLTIILIILQSCLTTGSKENAMKFNKNKISFSFSINNKIVKGEIETLNDRYHVIIDTDNNIMSGDILSFSNKITYSLIYKNQFVKGTFIFNPDNKIYNVNFNILNKSLIGEILNQNISSIINLVYDNEKIKGNWEHEPDKNLIKWDIQFHNKYLTVFIKEKNNISYYTFESSELMDEDIIIFFILEIFRMHR